MASHGIPPLCELQWRCGRIVEDVDSSYKLRLTVAGSVRVEALLVRDRRAAGTIPAQGGWRRAGYGSGTSVGRSRWCKKRRITGEPRDGRVTALNRCRGSSRNRPPAASGQTRRGERGFQTVDARLRRPFGGPVAAAIPGSAPLSGISVLAAQIQHRYTPISVPHRKISSSHVLPAADPPVAQPALDLEPHITTRTCAFSGPLSWSRSPFGRRMVRYSSAPGHVSEPRHPVGSVCGHRPARRRRHGCSAFAPRGVVLGRPRPPGLPDRRPGRAAIPRRRTRERQRRVDDVAPAHPARTRPHAARGLPESPRVRPCDRRGPRRVAVRGLRFFQRSRPVWPADPSPTVQPMLNNTERELALAQIQGHSTAGVVACGRPKRNVGMRGVG